jgi:hypothetical protein
MFFQIKRWKQKTKEMSDLEKEAKLKVSIFRKKSGIRLFNWPWSDELRTMTTLKIEWTLHWMQKCCHLRFPCHWKEGNSFKNITEKKKDSIKWTWQSRWFERQDVEIQRHQGNFFLL